MRYEVVIWWYTFTVPRHLNPRQFIQPCKPHSTMKICLSHAVTFIACMTTLYLVPFCPSMLIWWWDWGHVTNQLPLSLWFEGSSWVAITLSIRTLLSALMPLKDMSKTIKYMQRNTMQSNPEITLAVVIINTTSWSTLVHARPHAGSAWRNIPCMIDKVDKSFMLYSSLM